MRLCGFHQELVASIERLQRAHSAPAWREAERRRELLHLSGKPGQECLTHLRHAEVGCGRQVRRSAFQLGYGGRVPQA